jgi:Type IX secretion system protein PorV
MRPTALKLTAGLLLFCGLSSTVKAQVDPINVVTTAVPFLRISPDARSGAMGDLGIATSPDQYSGLWNMGKVAFNQSSGIGVTYTPWLKDLVNDVYLLTLSGHYKFDDKQAISASVRYFSLGSIEFTDNLGNVFGNFRPREFGIDVGYSRQLNAKNGVGIALKYINSNLAGGTTVGSTTYKSGSSVAADLGWYHDSKAQSGSGWQWGVVLQNLGAKISYTDNADAKDFIPANLGLGANYTKKFNATNSLSLGLELNKLLVPTPPAEGDAAALADYRKKGVLGSWFSSFGDAPGGFGEEIKEFQVGAGAEYWYNGQFALRAGYFYENKTKGNRRYFTTGLGLKYNIFGFNFAYLIPTGSGVSRNPLSNTLRFSILFDLSKGKK